MRQYVASSLVLTTICGIPHATTRNFSGWNHRLRLPPNPRHDPIHAITATQTTLYTTRSGNGYRLKFPTTQWRT